MKHLSRSAILLLITLALFFNIERLDFGEANVIDIASFVYVLGLAAVLSLILIPILRRSNVAVSTALWTGIYLSSKFLLFQFFEERPLLGGLYTYLTITELVFILILVWLSHNFAAGLYEFEEAVKRITFSDSNRRIRQYHEADEDIQVEMFRSRHNHHPLSIIVVEPNAQSLQTTLHRLVQEFQQTMLSSYVINNMAQTLSKYLRRTDLILEQREKGRFIIVCPETNANDSELLVEYIQNVALEQLGTSVVYGMATFPKEAVTFEELVRQAESKLQHFHNGKNPL
jgi:GGDEF domain-containing protein